MTIEEYEEFFVLEGPRLQAINKTLYLDEATFWNPEQHKYPTFVPIHHYDERVRERELAAEKRRLERQLRADLRREEREIRERVREEYRWSAQQKSPLSGRSPLSGWGNEPGIEHYDWRFGWQAEIEREREQAEREKEVADYRRKVEEARELHARESAAYRDWFNRRPSNPAVLQNERQELLKGICYHNTFRIQFMEHERDLPNDRPKFHRVLCIECGKFRDVVMSHDELFALLRQTLEPAYQEFAPPCPS